MELTEKTIVVLVVLVPLVLLIALTILLIFFGRIWVQAYSCGANIDQLVGGATENTIIARVGHAIIAAVGSAASHLEVLAVPSQISDRAMRDQLDANTDFSIISIDISDVEPGENIGARLQLKPANSDMLTALANAEAHRAGGIATLQEMKARVRSA
jgi:uncharacterized protein YqfA (UPF0365 family)